MRNMRILITGAENTLSRTLLSALRSEYARQTKILMPAKDFMDITKKESVDFLFSTLKPHIVFHFEELDGHAEVLTEDLYKTNVNGTKNIVKACKKNGTRLIYLSTAHVFDGYKKTSYTVNDTPEPRCTYGETKLRSEKEVRTLHNSCIIRTTDIYSEDNDNYIKDFITKAKNGEVIPAYDDVYFSPTSEKDLAEWFITTMQSKKTGTFHVANKGCVSGYEFVCHVLEQYGLDPEKGVERISKSDDMINPPVNTALDTDCLNLNCMPTLPAWEVSVDRYVAELKNRKVKSKKD